MFGVTDQTNNRTKYLGGGEKKERLLFAPTTARRSVPTTVDKPEEASNPDHDGTAEGR